jgi:hypothetical protein
MSRYVLKYLSKALEFFGFDKWKQWGLLSSYVPPLWGLEKSERIVEYAWVLLNLEISEGRILDVGVGNSMFPIMLASLGLIIYAVDLNPYPLKHPNLIFIRGDINKANLPENYFDHVLFISTLEHIGADRGPLNYDDKFTLQKTARLLHQNGKMLITVPFGPKFAIVKGPTWYRVYDKQRLARLTEGMSVEKINFFSRVLTSWIPVDPNFNFNPICKPVSDVTCLKVSTISQL